MKIRRFLIILFFPFVLHAQTSAPRFQVEIILFENLSSQNLTHENAATPPEISRSAIAITQALTQSQKRNFVTLAKSYFLMNREASSLQRSGKYKVLLHSAWIQPIASTHPTTIYFSSNELGSHDGAVINGTITFSRAKFLNAIAQLALSMNGDVARTGLSEQRRLRTKDVNYFDNPQFGMLLKVVPV